MDEYDHVLAVFDSGSETSLITTETVQKFGLHLVPKYVQMITPHDFLISGSTQRSTHSVTFSANALINEDMKSVQLSCCVIPEIPTPNIGNNKVGIVVGRADMNRCAKLNLLGKGD